MEIAKAEESLKAADLCYAQNLYTSSASRAYYAMVQANWLRVLDTTELSQVHQEVIAPEATVQDAAEKMRQLDVGSLPVCDGEQVVGMLTDRDITVRAGAQGCDSKTTPVCEAITPDLVYGGEDHDVQEATHLMEQQQIRRLPVLNRPKRLVGIVSLGALAVSPGAQTLVGEVLDHISEPAEPRR